ncbi:MAG TPA: FAD-linked oxidase C-terminal domain-containing protein [Solirubrobacteraceae bacterium]|jgi:FAD/FMN-containing dehydrogenase/Fe-S oxidoreductase
MYAIEPLLVAFPRHEADVVAAVELCRDRGVPLLARGAGTSLAGQTVGRALVLDLSRHMNRIVDVDPGARTARVQPGVVQDDLNAAAQGYGLMFGADTSTSNRATLGGMIGNNSSGTHSVRFGTTHDHVRALEVVLADGGRARFEPLGAEEWDRRKRLATLEGAICRDLPGIVQRNREAIVRDHPGFWRQSGGYRLDRLARAGEPYDLAKFLVGSEGTLAVVTEADVDLIARPGAQAIAVGHFRSTAEAIAAAGDAIARDAAAVELMDHLILELSRQRLEYAALSEILEGEPSALLFVTFFGETEAEAVASVDRLAADWAANGHGYSTFRAIRAADRAAVLKVRKASLGLLMAASRGGRRPLAFVEDTAVPPERLPEYVQEFAAVLERHGLQAGFYGHCSVGCLHIRPFLDLREPPQVDTMRAVAEEVLELVLRYGGVNSSEHGDGLARSEFNHRVFGAELYSAMREVKLLFDPDGRLNPGKIVDAPAMTENLRDAALPAAARLRTHLRFGTDGMRDAADRCMNIGACRKTDAGVMCPSYMATREEQHSTRGRANALVKALSTPDPRGALGDERLHEIMDLCLECKACKSECPLSVDMASLKSEFLAQYQEIHGTPLRSRVFAAIRLLNRIGAATAPLSNVPGRIQLLRRGLDRGLGIAAQRPLPRFERDTLIRWFARRAAPLATAPRGEVVFLADSFTTFTEPAIGRACVELLERAGWRVHLHSRGCCGRASLSKGLLEQARSMATGLVDQLAPYAERGVPIVGCEPSCVLTLRDEYLDLLADDPRARTVADQVRLVPELLLAAIDDGSLRLDPASALAGRRIVVHAHCHEKAVTGTRATVELLRRIPGASVEEIDAGCCGMAGSFGFESEHYELSMRIGGLRLFPRLAAEDPEVIVAATGVSCRQQIAHGTDRRARHPVELIRSAVL